MTAHNQRANLPQESSDTLELVKVTHVAKGLQPKADSQATKKESLFPKTKH